MWNDLHKGPHSFINDQSISYNNPVISRVVVWWSAASCWFVPFVRFYFVVSGAAHRSFVRSADQVQEFRTRGAQGVVYALAVFPCRSSEGFAASRLSPCGSAVCADPCLAPPRPFKPSLSRNKLCFCSGFFPCIAEGLRALAFSAFDVIRDQDSGVRGTQAFVRLRGRGVAISDLRHFGFTRCGRGVYWARCQWCGAVPLALWARSRRRVLHTCTGPVARS